MTAQCLGFPIAMVNALVNMVPNGRTFIRQLRMSRLPTFFQAHSPIFYSGCYRAGALPLIIGITSLLPFMQTFVDGHVTIMHMMGNFTLAQI